MVLQVACETFCLDDDDTLLEMTLSLSSEALSAATVRFVEADPQPIVKGRYTLKLYYMSYMFLHIVCVCMYLLTYLIIFSNRQQI